MKKIILSLFIFMMLCISMSAYAAAETVKISVDGTIIQFEQPPIIVENIILAEFEPIAKFIGAEVRWKSETATIIYKDKRVALQIGNPNMSVLGQANPIALTVPPQMYNGKKYMPVEAIVRELGFSVSWDNASKTLKIKTPVTTPPPPTPPSSSKTPKIGDPLGDVVYSDIRAFINGYEIPTSITNGITMVVVEDLVRYGFDVAWSASAKTLRVEANPSKAFSPLKVEPNTKPVGTFKEKYVYTEIKTYLSGKEVASYAIKGVTLIDFELLKQYGTLKWNQQAKEIRLTIANNSYGLISIVANGNATTPTTALTITFDRAVPGLTVGDFTVTGATRGVLTGAGPVYNLTINNITVQTGQPITVSVYKKDLTFKPSSMMVSLNNPAIQFTNLTANGSDIVATTQLTITFDRPVPGLTASDFIITGAVRGALTQSSSSNNIYTLNISGITVADKANVTVQIVKAGYEFKPASRQIAVRNMPNINFMIITQNGSYSAPTTALTITLDKEIPGLNQNDIIITFNSNITLTKKGVLAHSSGTSQYILPISLKEYTYIKNGDILNVRIIKTGYNINPVEGRDIVVYNPQVKELAYISISTDPDILEGYEDETIYFTLYVLAVYNDNSSRYLTENEYKIYYDDFGFTVSYTENGITKTAYKKVTFKTR